ncbi:hypothetical protein SAMN05660909_04796 [Chitinophaga terrae (ex Kim and Jung 2007)]|jgi:hypothetical protein|uniref:Uncharacterized protein n=1 Tax=Chitinophaga terrae (ex Kim and Jung 2007) TaxID=408074 RepID=A0A1H4FYX7_9BACT|nr:hypothetical protein [Chitinophaga terrae (ex Kim and Jung 2007)]MDQ0109526.1 hypothetical protein [Chitinophaga terrae (ex Kim and Jung 2007)]GEP92903.1 hypothetical protein CTE07_45480 [Chitinophaga terrae (ex Kim and Jung 2007)]SEB02553.1 hypothetical protein SAMN05660909_04796 [Chitinophaga terrae (ex Kim and Jung 2007)]
MQEIIVTVEGKDYTIQTQQSNLQQLYIVKACDADTVYCVSDDGEIKPRDISNPPEKLLKIGSAIKSYFA